MACRMLFFLSFHLLFVLFNFVFVDADGQNFFLFGSIGEVGIPFDDFQSLISMKLDFRRDQEYLWEEILLFEESIIIWFLDIGG